MTSIPSLAVPANVSAITGLPELPDNYYWEVEFYVYNTPRVDVKLMERKSRLTWPRKRKIEWGEQVTQTAIEYDKADSNLEKDLITKIRRLADETYQKSLNKLVLEKLAGQYPPKSLPLEDE
jgi:hypothetical protein